jgi:hypothetical protein
MQRPVSCVALVVMAVVATTAGHAQGRGALIGVWQSRGDYGDRRGEWHPDVRAAAEHLHLHRTALQCLVDGRCGAAESVCGPLEADRRRDPGALPNSLCELRHLRHTGLVTHDSPADCENSGIRRRATSVRVATSRESAYPHACRRILHRRRAGTVGRPKQDGPEAAPNRIAACCARSLAYSAASRTLAS